MKALRSKSTAGVSLIEMMLYTLMAVIIGAMIYGMLRTGSLLSAKNAALNRSHDDLRTALDRLANNLRLARNVPTLLNTAGAEVASGPAAGLRYDRIIGEPYAIEPVLTAGSLSAAQTSVSVYRSTTSAGAPPMPTVNDTLLIDTPSGSIRVR